MRARIRIGGENLVRRSLMDTFAEDLGAGCGGSDAGGFEEDLERLHVALCVQGALEQRPHLCGGQEELSGGLSRRHVDAFDQDDVAGIFEVGNVGDDTVGSIGLVARNAGEAAGLARQRVRVDDDAGSSELDSGGELEVELLFEQADPRVGVA